MKLNYLIIKLLTERLFGIVTAPETERITDTNKVEKFPEGGIKRFEKRRNSESLGRNIMINRKRIFY